MPTTTKIPKTGTRSTLDPDIASFLKSNPNLHLGGSDAFTVERSHHTRVFGFHALHSSKQAPIGSVEFTAVRGPHGTIPVRVFHPSSAPEKGKQGALVYMHGGGYTVGTVDEFENGLRLVAERAGVQVYAVEYRLAPEFAFPTQLDEYEAVLAWCRARGAGRGAWTRRRCAAGVIPRVGT